MEHVHKNTLNIPESSWKVSHHSPSSDMHNCFLDKSSLLLGWIRGGVNLLHVMLGMEWAGLGVEICYRVFKELFSAGRVWSRRRKDTSAVCIHLLPK
jgi:hypothetical protein